MANGEWGGLLDQRVFRANIIWESALQRCQTGFHIRDVGINTLSPQDVANEVANFVQDSMLPIFSSRDRILGVDAVNLATKEGASVNFSNLIGAASDPESPSFIMVPISLKGNLRRRYANGRMLWPVRSYNYMGSNQLTPGGINVFTAATTALADRFIGPAITQSMHLAHVHEALPALGNRPAIPASWYDITSVRFGSLLSSLRRRKVGVGS